MRGSLNPLHSTGEERVYIEHIKLGRDRYVMSIVYLVMYQVTIEWYSTMGSPITTTEVTDNIRVILCIYNTFSYNTREL